MEIKSTKPRILPIKFDSWRLWREVVKEQRSLFVYKEEAILRPAVEVYTGSTLGTMQRESTFLEKERDVGKS